MLFDPKGWTLKGEPLTAKGDLSLIQPIRPPQLGVVKLDDNARLPEKAHDGDLGYDLFALEDTEIAAGGVTKVRTGIALNFPKGYGALLRDRSSVATKRELFVVAGVIDQGYTGEIIVAFYNPGDVELEISHSQYSERLDIVRGTKRTGNDRFIAGEKIAQLILTPVVTFPVVEATKTEDTSRGSNGFGSTGS